MARLLWILPLLLLLLGAAVRAEIDGEDFGDDIVENMQIERDATAEGDPFDAAGPAPGVETVYFFPNNPHRQIPAGEEIQLLLGISNNGDSVVSVHGIRASVHYPFDHKLVVQNITGLAFVNATVPPGFQATYAYPVVVSKFLQPGNLDLVATVDVQVNDGVYRSVFYNGTVDIVEPSGFISMETVFLVLLGLGLLGLFGMWIHGQVQKIGKNHKTKTTETGTRSADAINNEWLQGTAFSKKSSSKSPTAGGAAKIKKKK